MTIELDGRMAAVKKLLLLLTLFPLTLIYGALFVVLGVLAAIWNNVYLLFVGEPYFDENNPMGYLIYWSSNNAQAVLFGRGEYGWIPPLSVLWS